MTDSHKHYDESAPLLRQGNESFGPEISEGSASDGIPVALSRNTGWSSLSLMALFFLFYTQISKERHTTMFQKLNAS